MPLNARLNEWRAAGLISVAQAERITAYEADKPRNRWALYGLLALASTAIGIGVISLIAANWDEIPKILKLLANFAALAGLAFGAHWAWRTDKPLHFEVFLLLFALMCLAAIGLISQVYHISSNMGDALFTWSLITAGVAAFARRALLPWLWFGAFLTSLIYQVYQAHQAEWLMPILNKNLALIGLNALFISALLTHLYQRLGSHPAQTFAPASWTILLGIVGAIAAPMEWLHGPLQGSDAQHLVHFIPTYILALLLLASIWRMARYTHTQKRLFSLLLLVYMVPFHYPLLDITFQTAYMASAVVIWLVAALCFASLGRRRMFQVFLVLAGWYFVRIYLQALGGLAMTGVGLIVAGGMIILMIVLWHKYRKPCAQWLERWMPDERA